MLIYVEVTPPLHTFARIMSVREPIRGQLAAQFLDWDQWLYVGGTVGCTEPCTHCMFTVCVCVWSCWK